MFGQIGHDHWRRKYMADDLIGDDAGAGDLVRPDHIVATATGRGLYKELEYAV